MKLLRLIAACALASTVPASAAVIYSGNVNMQIPINTLDGVYVDVDAGLFATTPITGWDVNFFFGGSEIATSPDFLPIRAGTGNLDAIRNVLPGSAVNGSSSFYSSGFGGSENVHMGTGPGLFETGTSGYIAFQMMSNSVPGPSTGPLYGWMQVTLTNNAPGGVIERWAYDNTGAAINVGFVPEPSTWAGLAGLAALAAAAFHRKRAAKNLG